MNKKSVVAWLQALLDDRLKALRICALFNDAVNL